MNKQTHYVYLDAMLLKHFLMKLQQVLILDLHELINFVKV